MKRENRYLVVKRSDVHKYLTEAEMDVLDSLNLKIADGRKADGKQQHLFVCVADHWPEYEKVWEMIEDRVDKGNAP